LPAGRVNWVTRFLLIFCLSTATNSISQAQDTEPKFKFESKSVKFEKVKAGEILSFDYIFENTGSHPLIITNIKVSCSCTKPLWPKEPIKPGKKDTIHVKFDTKGKIGWQDRILEVHSNAKDSPTKLRFKGMVDNKEYKE